jgi:outer membrane protein
MLLLDKKIYQIFIYIRNILTTVLTILCCNSYIYAENLLDIYFLAKDNDPTIISAKQTQLADLENLIIARAKFLPNISASTTNNYAKNRDVLGQLNSYNPTEASYNNYSYTLNIAQPIFQVVDWMSYKKTKKQSKSALKKYENAEQELLLRVAEQYFAILAAMDQEATSKAIIESFTKRLEQAKKQFKVGVTAITDVNEAEARLDNARATHIADYNNLNNEKEKLSRIIGKFVEQVAPLKSEIPLVSPTPNDVSLWVEKSRKHNLKIQAARYDVEAAYEAVRASSSNHLPTVNLNGSVTKSKSMPPNVNKNHVKQISVSVALPIFSGGAVVAASQTATFQTNIALQELEAAYRAAESGTKIAYNTVLTQISQVSALHQSVKSNNSALRATTAALDVGTRTIVDVLNAQTDLLSTKKNYALAKYKYIMSGLNLKKETGSLSLEDLEQVNNLLIFDQDSNKDCDKHDQNIAQTHSKTTVKSTK